MHKPTLIIISLAVSIILVAQTNAQNCDAVGYRDRMQSDRSSRCPDTNRCCNDTDTTRIGELIMRQREYCWSTVFNNSRRAFNAFIEQYQGLIESIAQRSAMDSFGDIPTTPDSVNDFYDESVMLNGEEIGDMARYYIRNNTNIDLVRTQFDDAVCSLIAGRVLRTRFASLQNGYFICGNCLCNRSLADRPSMTVRDLVRERLQNAWIRYSGHLKRLRLVVNQIRNISSEGMPNRGILDLCNTQAIRLLGCRRCAGFNEGTCDRVCTSLEYFCREAYRRSILVHQSAPRTFLSIARALQDDSTRESNQFNTGNTREAARMISSSIGELERSGYAAFQSANRGRDTRAQLCLFALNATMVVMNDTTPSRPGPRACMSPSCTGCTSDCATSTCQGSAGRRCTLPNCMDCPSRSGVTQCQCVNLKRRCRGRRRRELETYSRRALDSRLSTDITSFYDMANAARTAGEAVTFNTIFRSDCVCGSSLDRFREISLGGSSNCYNPFGDFTPSVDFRNNSIFRNLSSSQQMQYQEGASVEALESDLNTFEMEVSEGNTGSSAGRISFSIATVMVSLMLMLLFV